jgi:hypothetical protein
MEMLMYIIAFSIGYFAWRKLFQTLSAKTESPDPEMVTNSLIQALEEDYQTLKGTK